jgi:hypothetical protein
MSSDATKFSNNIVKIYKDNSDAIRIIFEYNLLNSLDNVNISTRDYKNNNILHLIVNNNDNKTLLHVLNYINVINPNMKQMVNQQNNDGDTPLHIAARNGNEEAARALHRSDASLHIRNNNGEVIEDSETRTVSGKRCMHPFDIDNMMYNDMEIIHGNRSVQRALTPTREDSDKIISLLRRNLVVGGTSDPKIFMMNGGNDEFSDLSLKVIDIEMNGGCGEKRQNPLPVLAGGSVESDKLHTQVIEFFKKLTGNEDDARALKAALYSLVKKEHPEFNGMQRAEKMIDYIKDKKIVDKINNQLDEYREIIRNAKANKDDQGRKAQNSVAPKEDKPKKTRAKKTKTVDSDSE